MFGTDALAVLQRVDPVPSSSDLVAAHVSSRPDSEHGLLDSLGLQCLTS